MKVNSFKKLFIKIKSLNHKLQYQVLVSFLILIFIPTILVLVIMYNIYFNFISDKTQMYTSQLINQVNITIDSKLMIYNNLTRQIYSNKAIIESMKKPYKDTYEKYEIQKSVADIMLSLINIDKYVLSSYIMTNDGRVYYSGYGTPYNDGNYEKIRKKAFEADGRVVWIPTEKLQSILNDMGFSAVREIKSQNGTKVGTLVLIISDSFFNDIYKNINLSKTSTNIVVSQDLTVVSSMDKKLIGKQLENDYLKKAVKLKNGSFVEKIGNKKTLIVFSTSNVTGWTFVSYIPLHELLKEVYSIKNIILTIIVIFIIFLSFLIYIFPKKITKPIKNLSEKIKMVQEGCFTITVDDTSEDEIGALSRTFNVMVKKINELVTEVKEKEKEKGKAELLALQSQINPHFMYNTLNSIKFIAILNKQDAIKKMLSAFIKLLRNVAKNGDELITITEEIELLDNYVYIQNVRFGNFNINYEVPEDIKNNKIMKFTIQPVVENCILHGFSEKGMFGEINIKIFIKEEKLYIQIKDNGIGMSQEDLSKLYLGKSDNTYNKMGIKNINDRIVLNYSNKYGISIESTFGVGTIVTIVLPLIL
ncbi:MULTISPECIES: sensor histidine kinase [Clostridium]|uniref:Histidine kinase n=1 Tax=Clostridium frigoriphilum TaxID=443253 RepID=A0ABU7UU57_9CLOT|nr:sensor histidine kinase [Clostridium sp. DSM 17811]MBU3099416.1 histidine kinase [Clostridium sp. DSM 17811]